MNQRTVGYPSTSFLSPILAKLATRALCGNTRKTVEQVFEILLLKFLAIFLKFYISSGAF